MKRKLTDLIHLELKVQNEVQHINTGYMKKWSQILYTRIIIKSQAQIHDHTSTGQLANEQQQTNLSETPDSA